MRVSDCNYSLSALNGLPKVGCHIDFQLHAILRSPRRCCLALLFFPFPALLPIYINGYSSFSSCPISWCSYSSFLGCHQQMRTKSLVLPRPFLLSVFSAHPRHYGKRHHLQLLITVNVNVYGIWGRCEGRHSALTRAWWIYLPGLICLNRSLIHFAIRRFPILWLIRPIDTAVCRKKQKMIRMASAAFRVRRDLVKNCKSIMQ
jgi:hypothetical protein